MTARDPASLDLRHLDVTVEQQQRLHDIELHVLPGELIFIVGRQDSGKSSLLRAIAGLDPIAGGEIWIDEQEITRMKPAKRKIAMLSQSAPLWPHLDVGRNIAFALRGRGLRKAEVRSRTERELSTVGLAEFIKHLPAQLNASQQQHVALARTLCADSRVMLLDEPFSAQDPILHERLLQGLKRRLQHASITTLLTSEDPQEALRFADRIAVLHEGELLQIGSPQELYDKPAHRHVAEYFGNVNVIDGEIEIVGDQPLFHADNGIVIPVFEQAVKRARTGSAMFRPHDLRLVESGDEPFGDRIRLIGRVEHNEFRGNSIRYGVAVSGDTLWVDLPRKHDTLELEIGDSVVLGLDPAHVHILER